MVGGGFIFVVVTMRSWWVPGCGVHKVTMVMITLQVGNVTVGVVILVSICMYSMLPSGCRGWTSLFLRTARYDRRTKVCATPPLVLLFSLKERVRGGGGGIGSSFALCVVMIV